MGKSVQLFVLMLLASLVISHPVTGQSLTHKQLVGRWIAHYKIPYGYSELGTDGISRHYNDDIVPDSVIIEFKLDRHGSIWWPNSAKAQLFTYRLINPKVIEMRYADKKPWQHTITLRSNKLSLGEYPIPKEPQESIALLYTFLFFKRP